MGRGQNNQHCWLHMPSQLTRWLEMLWTQRVVVFHLTTRPRLASHLILLLISVRWFKLILWGPLYAIAWDFFYWLHVFYVPAHFAWPKLSMTISPSHVWHCCRRTSFAGFVSLCAGNRLCIYDYIKPTQANTNAMDIHLGVMCFAKRWVQKPNNGHICGASFFFIT